MTSIWIILSNPNDIDHSFNPNQNLLSTFLVGSPKPLIPLAALPEITTEVTCDIQTWGLWHWKELQIKDVQTARAKGSSGGWGQLCTGKTFTVENNFYMALRRDCHLHISGQILGSLWIQNFKEIGGTEKREEIKKNGCLKKLEKLFRYERDN